MPDGFVPIDTSFFSQYYTDALRKGVLNDFIMQYVDANRKELLRTYPDISSFTKGFRKDQELLNDFVESGSKNELPRDDKGLELSGKQITSVLKGLLARNLYNVSAYFEVIGKEDDDLKQAVQIIQNESLFRKLTMAN